MVTRGNLIVAVGGAAISPSAATVDVTWTDNSGSGSAMATDKALILLFNATRGESVFTTAGPERSAGPESISVPSEYTGENVEVFLGVYLRRWL